MILWIVVLHMPLCHPVRARREVNSGILKIIKSKGGKNERRNI